MHLQVNEQRYIATLKSNGEIEIDYNFTNYSSQLNDVSNIVVEQYVCLFDDNWAIVDEVFSFLEHRLEVKRLSFNTVIAKGVDLKLFYDFLECYNLQYHQIEEKDINDFVAWLLLPDAKNSENELISSKRTAKSTNRIVSTIKDFYQYHSKFNKIENPFLYATETIKRPTGQHKSFYTHTQNGLVEKSIFKIKEFDKGVRVLTKEQIETILATCTMQRDRLLFELLLFTGMRIGEALSLDIHAIGLSDLRERVQSLPLQSNEDDFRKGNQQREQKSGTRDLFIPTTLMKKLFSYYETTWLSIYEKRSMEHNYFFISEFHNNLGEPLSYQAVWDRCRKIGKSCGIFFTPHDFRHTFATILARNSVGIERLSKLLGHRDIGSTNIYIEIAKKEDIMEELVPFYKQYGV